MHTRARQATSSIVCYVAGNLESETVAAFRDLVAGICPAHNVIFDFRRVAFVDSVGLGALLGAIRRIRESGGDVIISGLCPSVARALHFTAIDRCVGVVPDLDAAEHYFSAIPAA